MSIAKFPFLLLLPFVSVCFRIDAEYSITIQSQNEDHVTDHIKYLFLLNMSRLIRKGMLCGLDFPSSFSEFSQIIGQYVPE